MSRSGLRLAPPGPPAAFESGGSFAGRSPPGAARSRSGLRGASFRWTRQQPSKAATAPQIAAPQSRPPRWGR
eukprot:7618453-Pyramimonas_sp.AAC.1